MGTRSLTYVLDYEQETPLVCIYRQMDGYPECHGRTLYNICAPRRIVNGFQLTGPDDYKDASNGMECLAATLVKELKTGIGMIYLHPIQHASILEEANACWADYVYTVYPIGADLDHLTVQIRVQAMGPADLAVLYDGPVTGMAAAFGFPRQDQPGLLETVQEPQQISEGQHAQ